MDLRTQIADNITALVDPYQHAETLHLRSPTPGGQSQEIRIHRVNFPSLLEQLEDALEPGGNNEPGAAGYASRPNLSIEALSHLRTIRDAAHGWIHDVGGTPPADLAAALRKLVGLDWNEDQLDDLVRATRRWVTQARIILDWETAPFKPNAACPVCNNNGTLRINLAKHTGRCINEDCEATWDRASIGILAEHVRAAKAARKIVGANTQ